MERSKLVSMANQVAQAFRLQADPAALTADHLRSFWSPAMRRALVELADVGGPGLEPHALEAARLLAAESTRPPGSRA